MPSLIASNLRDRHYINDDILILPSGIGSSFGDDFPFKVICTRAVDNAVVIYQIGNRIGDTLYIDLPIDNTEDIDLWFGDKIQKVLVNTDIDNINTDIDNINTDIDNINTDIDNINSILNNLDTVFLIGTSTDTNPVQLSLSIGNSETWSVILTVCGRKTDGSKHGQAIRQLLVSNELYTNDESPSLFDILSLSPPFNQPADTHYAAAIINTVATIGTDNLPVDWSIDITINEDNTLGIIVTGEDTVKWIARAEIIKISTFP